MGLETPGYGVAVTNPGMPRMGLAPTHHPASPRAPGGFFWGDFVMPSPLQWGRSGCVGQGCLSAAAPAPPPLPRELGCCFSRRPRAKLRLRKESGF